MKNKVISIFMTLVMICGLCCILPNKQVKAAGISISSSDVVSKLNAKVGGSFPDGMCLKFVADFWTEMGATRSSACCASKYGDSFITSTSMDNIPIGADVFFGNCGGGPCSKCNNGYYGHIGVYVGDGQFIHATGGKIQKTAISSWSSKYRGWGFHENINVVNPTPEPTPTPTPTPSPDNNRQPLLTLDSATGGAGEIKLYGWSYDPDTLSASVTIHVYISPATDTNKMIMAGSFKADNGRPDVDDVYSCGSMHGFDDTIYVTEPGEYLIRVAALDTTYGGDAATWVQGDFVWVTESPKYTIKYDVNGGTGTISSQTKTKGIDIKLTTNAPTKSYTLTYNAMGGEVSANSKKISCKFLGWSTSKNGTPEYKSGATFTKNANTTLYAAWQNQKIGELPVPTKNGYTFDGWYTGETGGSKLTADTVISKNTTIYAHWTKKQATGDINADGVLSISDAVLLQKWLLGSDNIDSINLNNADLCSDGRIDVFDLIVMREKLVA